MAKALTVNDLCQVAPPANTAAQTLPLTYFDIIWVYFHPIQRLLFYRFPCSASHFHKTIVPNLKNSLSQTLKHYLPLAGNLYVPLNASLPELRYVPGDSVSFTVAETSDDSDSNAAFEYLIGNKPRDADKFYPFVPDLAEPETDKSGSFKTIPVLSVQVTLFPETGICIGITNHHAAGDASSIVGFIKAWSALARFGEDEQLLTKSAYSFPVFDRWVVKDPSQRRANTFWNQMKLFPVDALPKLVFPTNKVRQTFVMSKDDILSLRNLVLSKKPRLTHLSSFTITAAFVWSCLAKIAAEAGEEVNNDESEYFMFGADTRQRMDPPVPKAYFGNCLAFAMTESTHGELKSSGEDGFLNAVEAVSRLISEKVNNKEEVLRDVDEWFVKYPPLFGKRIFGVAGSPKFDLYDTDFGCGNPVKYEAVSIDGDSSMSLCKSREFEGGLEIGLSMPKKKMEAFESVFNGGLKV